MVLTPSESPRTTLSFDAPLPGPPDPTIAQLQEQLRQLTLLVSSQQETISQLQAESSGASVPSPEAARPSQPPPIPAPTEASAVDLITALTESLRRAATDVNPATAANRELQGRARTLSNLLQNAPRYDGTSDVYLYRKRITEYLHRRQVTDESMIIDILCESCQKGASDYLGSLEWPIESPRDFWHALESRYGRDALSKMGDFDNLKQKPGQSYRRYADVMMERAYGLNIPREAMLRKYLQTMLHGNELRRYLIPQLANFEDVRSLAAAVEQLTQDEPAWQVEKGESKSSKCRICNKSGHFASACPLKNKRTTPSSRPTVPAAAEAEVEHQEEEEFAEDYEFLEEYEEELEVTTVQAQPAEKRSAPEGDQHREMLKRLRTLRPVRAAGEGPSGAPATTLPPPPPRQVQRPAATAPVAARQRGDTLTNVPLRGYRAPAPQANRPIVQIARSTAAAKSLRRTLEGNIDVPASMLMGLVLKASTNPQRLTQQWIQHAEQELHSLLPTPQLNEIEDNMLEIESNDTKVVINPLTSKEGVNQRYVGYLPIKLGAAQELYWALADTGAQVSVISAGLAAYLNLYNEDMSNVHPATFSVTGYNGTASYMPVLETTARMGARGGDERLLQMHFCILDTNSYKLIVGVDVMNKLQFVYDGPNRRIHLQNLGVRFALPLATKDYAFNAPSVRAYRSAVEKLSSSTADALEEVDISMTAEQELGEELQQALESAEEAQHSNILSWGCRYYADSQEHDLTSTLYLAQLQYHTEEEDSSSDGSSTATPLASSTTTPPSVALKETAPLGSTATTPTVSVTDAVVPLTDATPPTVALKDARVSIDEVKAFPSAASISATQFEDNLEVNTLLPQQQDAGDMGTASLPKGEAKGLSTTELQSFLDQYGLEPCAGEAPLNVRAAKLKQAIETNELLVDPSRSADQKRQAYQMLLSIADVFATSMMDLAVPAKGERFSIDTGSAVPIKQKPFKMGRKEIEFLNVTILGQLDADIVRHSSSPWSSPAFVAYARPYWSTAAPKARKVIDYRKINRVTRSDTYPLPDIPALLEWLSHSRYFGAIDLKSGYWQKETEPQDVCKTAFVTPNGLHEYLRVPFGLKNAPAFFQRAITSLLQKNNIQHSRGFVDDLLTGGDQWLEYLQHQKQLFTVLRQNHWLVTISKVRLGYTEIAALGHVVGHQYIKPDPDKVNAVSKLKPPCNVHEVRAFLGLVGYYRRFIANFAKTAKPLTMLTSQEQPFVWEEQQEQAFRALQQQLTSVTLINTPTADGRYKVYTDYCSEALGAALHQVQGGEEKPIAFASRLCKGPEAVLSSAEGELCALIYALSKFRPYLGFEEFDVITDSSALLSLHSNQNLSSKLTRWSILLSEFNFRIIHKAGSSHKNADGLSRCRQNDEEGAEGQLHVWHLTQKKSFLEDDLICCQGTDDGRSFEVIINELHDLYPQLRGQCIMCGGNPHGRMLLCGRCGASQHANCCPRRPPPCYWYCPPCSAAIERDGGPQDITEDVAAQLHLLGGPCPPHYDTEAAQQLCSFYIFRRGELLAECSDGYRAFPPAYVRQHIVEKYHHMLMHAGWRATSEAVKSRYFWPGLEADVKSYCRACLSCQLETAVFRRQDVLSGHLTANRPRVAWSLDCAPSIKTRQNERASILVIVDDFTRYVLCVVLPRLDSMAVRQAFLERVLSVYGRPERVRTDGGREFAGEFTTLMEALNIQHIKTRTVSPWTNGRAERMVRHVKSLLRRSLFTTQEADWQQLLPWVVAAINATVSRTTGYPPHEIFFGEAPSPLVAQNNVPVDIRLGDETAQNVDAYVRLVKRHLRQLQDNARRTQEQYEAGLEQDYESYPVAGRQYAGDSQMALKAPHQTYYRGQLVMLKRMKGSLGQHNHHFALGAAGPYIVIDEKGDSVLLQNAAGGSKWQNKANCLPLRTYTG